MVLRYTGGIHSSLVLCVCSKPVKVFVMLTKVHKSVLPIHTSIILVLFFYRK